MSSHRATTTALVRDLDLTYDDLRAAVEAHHVAAGLGPDVLGAEDFADLVEDLLRDRFAVEDHAGIRRRSMADARPVSGATVMTTPWSAVGPFAVSNRTGI